MSMPPSSQPQSSQDISNLNSDSGIRSSPAPASSNSHVAPRLGEANSKKRPSPEEHEEGDADRIHDGDYIAPSTADLDSSQQNKGGENTAGRKQSAGPPPKKRKLTQAEKEEREKEKARKEAERLEKEKEKERERAEKEKEKAEKKAALEEKKRAVEEAKKKKDEEKRKKDEERAEAKKKKDEEQRKKDQDKAKKERAQTRLSAFFAIPKSDPVSPSKGRPATLTPDRGTDEHKDNSTNQKSVPPVDKQPSDYEKYFKPFYVKQHVTLAPQHSFTRDAEYKSFIKRKLDELLATPLQLNPPQEGNGVTVAPAFGVKQAEIIELLHLPHHKQTKRGKTPKYTTKQLLELINTSEAELNLGSTLSAGKYPPDYYLELLKSLPQKHLQFAEDVRPPYCGTFTRVPPEKSALRKGKNPFERCLPNIDYDYDSETEWIAPEDEEEGEDLLSEAGDEEEEDEEDEEDMDEFLDDEEDAVKRRAGALCPLQPFSSGLCWENENGKNEKREFREMKMGILLEGVSGPIDPFSDRYWLPPPKLPSSNSNSNSAATAGTSAPFTNSTMSTFLSTSSSNPSNVTPKRPITNILTIAQGPKKLIPPEDLEAFKKAVDGSDMTKAGLVELLKKQFPKASKDAIRETLGKVAVRMGGKEADKRWVLRE
ncbi:chromatin assembly factor 1 subunit A-domain-containing protein [Kalaharituber pfeilii]|nr:chromatin assembly factor 1 subunit A-domain-containing protein [Kalaharituber pfeilii]